MTTMPRPGVVAGLIDAVRLWAAAVTTFGPRDGETDRHYVAKVAAAQRWIDAATTPDDRERRRVFYDLGCSWGAESALAWAADRQVELDAESALAWAEAGELARRLWARPGCDSVRRLAALVLELEAYREGRR